MNEEEIWDAIAAGTISEEQAVMQLQSLGYSEALAQETVLIALGGDEVGPKLPKRTEIWAALIVFLIASLTVGIVVTTVRNAPENEKQTAVARAEFDEKMASALLHALPLGSKLSARQISNQLLEHRVAAKQYLLKAAAN
jgi:hypothetical protein